MDASRPRTRAGAGRADSVRLPEEPAVSFIFFVSGAAGLIFEVVWFYRCGLVFGNSSWATSIVLSSFMGGLALGNALVALYAHRLRLFLRTYAAAEFVVAASGLALTYQLPQLTNFVASVTRPFVDTLWLVNLVRLATAFTVLVLPATAIGTTLPLLLGALSRQRTGFGRVLGRLYGWNTLGAVAGVVAAEVVLIPRFGVIGSAWTAALLDTGAALGALAISRRVGHALAVGGAAPEPRPAIEPIPWRLLTGAFLAGGALMALEVVWFRFLSMLVVSNTLAVSVMLATMLTAIGLGGLAASLAVARWPRAVGYLPAIAVAAGCVMALSYGTFQFVTTATRAADWQGILWFACWLTLPTALLSGVIFTLIGDALKHKIASEARAAGWLTFANTAGAMAGPVVAAFVLLPLLGMERALFALFIVYGLIGLLVVRDTSQGPRAAVWALRATGVTAMLVVASFPFGLMSGTYFVRSVSAYSNDGSEIVATREGTAETIVLMRQAWQGNPIYYRLVTNGFSMSGTAVPGKRYMRYFVYLPMLLHKAPIGRVLVICYGVGVTAGAATDLPSATSIDIVDISRDIVAMSDHIYSGADHPLRDPRVRLHVEDGRYFLQSTRERFDLITGEPPPPLSPGTVNIYTREYFQLIYDRLAEGGISTYWLPVARQNAADLTTIIRAFCDVFEDCSLWNGTPTDLMLMGTRHAEGPISGEHFSSPWTLPRVGPHLREAGFELPEQIGATFVGDAPYLRRLTETIVPLVDDYPRRLFLRNEPFSPSDPRYFFDTGGVEFLRIIDPLRARPMFAESAFVRRLWPEPLLRDTLPFFDVQRMINHVLLDGSNPLRDIQDVHLLLTRTRLKQLPYWLLGLGNHPILQHVDDMPNDGSGQVEYVRGLRALVARDYGGAAAHLAQAAQRGLPGTRPLVAYALCLAGKPDAARQLAPEGEPPPGDQRHFWSWIQATCGLGSAGN